MLVCYFLKRNRKQLRKSKKIHQKYMVKSFNKPSHDNLKSTNNPFLTAILYPLTLKNIIEKIDCNHNC